MIEGLRSYIRHEKLILPGERVLLAVSGGMDSMLLLQLLHQLDYVHGVAHCNFQLRAKESDEDERFVKMQCKKMKLPFYHIRFETSAYAKKMKLGVQEAARELRYDWFRKIMKQEGFDKLATAHHAADQAETVLFHLVRGTGLKGLQGIPVQNESVIRPLLFAGREQIEDYVKKQHIPFRTDSSNASLKYSRNRIRHELMPVLKKISPDVETQIGRLSGIVKQANDFIQEECKAWIQKHAKAKKDVISLSLEDLRMHHSGPFLLYHILQPYGFHADQLTQLWDSFQSQPGQIFYSEHYRLMRDRGQLILEPRKKEKEVKEIWIEGRKGNYTGENFELSWSTKRAPKKFSPDPSLALLDPDKLSFPLQVRTWQQGDKFRPLGMRGMKKLSDLYTDLKLGRKEKEESLVMLSGGDIVWAMNQRIDDRFKLEPGSTQVFEISYKKL